VTVTFALSDTSRYVADGGLETDLIYHRGVDLPAFASFPLLEGEVGRGHLTDYYDGYAAIAEGIGAGLLLEAPSGPRSPRRPATTAHRSRRSRQRAPTSPTR
jgi:homocysteine S-methyltransferase